MRRTDGTIETLSGCDQTRLKPGEAVIVTTPTGGGLRQAVSEIALRRATPEDAAEIALLLRRTLSAALPYLPVVDRGFCVRLD